MVTGARWAGWDVSEIADLLRFSHTKTDKMPQ